ncbi:MAG: heavy metal sensor histidine kinase [Chlorobiota bacterium]|nr:MAG: heavy metal sensor histidine kinase [Chlorobiota bacterium]
MNISLRFKLVLWFGAIMALALGAFGTLAYSSVRNKLISNLDNSLNNVIETLDGVLAKEPGKEKISIDPKRIKSLIDNPTDKKNNKNTTNVIVDTSTKKTNDALSEAIYEQIILNPRNFMIEVLDKNNKVIYSSASLAGDTLKLPIDFISKANEVKPEYQTFQHNPSKSEPQTLRTSIYSKQKYIVVVAYPIDEIENFLKDFFGTILAITPIVLFFTLLVGWFITRQSLKPLSEIIISAQEISASNLSRRLPVPKPQDEIRTLTVTLNDMISRLESSFERVKQFTGDASHELRTPLTIIMGELELALRKKKSNEEYQDIISSSLNEVMRLSDVVKSLLMLSRAEQGKISTDMKETNLSEMMQELTEVATILAEPRNQYVTPRIEENLFVAADAPKLHQMFFNLIDNAIKYTPDNGMIGINLDSDGKYAIVRVRDTGIGISPEHQKKIFDRFYRVDKARSREMGGAGLGLSIVEWTVQEHNGDISVTSEVGQGSTFIVRIPLFGLSPKETIILKTKETTTQKISKVLDITRYIKKKKNN